MPSRKPLITIAVAEDDADDQLLLADALDAVGLDAEVVFVEDGAALLDYLHTGGAPEIDLIVLDLNLPRKDGRATLRDLKRDPRLGTIPVLILTTSSADRDVDECRRAGACDYVVKPASFASLVETVRLFPRYALRTA